MTRSILPFLLATPLFLGACGHGDKGTTAASDSASVAVAAAKRIHAMEDSLFNKPVFDRPGMVALHDVYIAYAKDFPKDTLAPAYLMRAAGISVDLHDGQAALDMYDRLIRDYAQWQGLEEVYYLKASVLDGELQKKGEAKMAYEEVISRYPGTKLAESARQMIDNLQYSDEELIKRFKAMNAEKDSTAGKGV